jgi:DNA end-binding protein Ku
LKRERVLMLQPWGKGLLGTTLRYPYEVRADEDYFDEIPDTKIPKDMLALAEHILDSKKADFDPSKFHDRYEQAIIEMINFKKAGMPVAKQRLVPKIVGGTDLMAALRQSIADTEREDRAAAFKAKSAPPAKGKKAPKRDLNQKEMLLPIAGSGHGKAAAKVSPAKEPAAAPSRRKRASRNFACSVSFIELGGSRVETTVP